MPNYTKKICQFCNKKYFIPKGKREKTSKFCSLECTHNNRRTGNWRLEKACNWKGGKIKRSGYWYINLPSHPNAGIQGYVAEHRLIMEKKIGRYLQKKEIVHHINGIKTDNRLENLELVKSAGIHSRDSHGRDYSAMAKLRKY